MKPELSNHEIENALATALPMPNQNPALVYIASLTSEESRRTMRTALNTITDIALPRLKDQLDKDLQLLRFQLLEWDAITFAHVEAIRARLIQKYAPATVNKLLSALRGVVGMAFRLGMIDAETYQRIRMVKSVKHETLPKGRDLSYGELQSLLHTSKEEPSHAMRRDAAVVAVLYGCGLRRAELVALDLADYERSTGKLLIRSGKGRKQRIVYITGGVEKAVKGWLAARGLLDGPLFLPVLKNDRIIARRMSSQAVYLIVKRLAEKADVDEFSPHDFRRTFVGDLLDRGADIATVSKLVGHADIKTTARYDRRPEEIKRKAIELLHVPF